jgi:hypothetical protein
MQILTSSPRGESQDRTGGDQEGLLAAPLLETARWNCPRRGWTCRIATVNKEVKLRNVILDQFHL